MQKLFEFDEHIGDWRVLIQSRDIQNGAIQGRHIAPGAVTTDKIGDGAVKTRHIEDGAITTPKIADGAVTTPKIAPGAVTGDNMPPGSVPNGKLSNDAVSTRNIKDGSVTPSKLDPSLLNEIRSAGSHGYALATQFGDSDLIGISQKTLTEAFHNFYTILSSITGEVYEGFSMAVTPDYYVGESGCTVTITANTLTTVGKFEWIAFYWNSEEEPFLYRENVYGIDGIEVELPLDKLLDDQIIIRCEAKILGRVYPPEQKAIRHCDSLWLGAGSQATDVMIPSNLIPASHHMRGAYDVSVAQGQHIIVVVGEALASGFIRADINGVEIDMTESTITQEGNTYKVFTSVNIYQAGTLNIDING